MNKPESKSGCETPPDGDLWFLPGPVDDEGPGDMPWPTAPRELALQTEDWLQAEAMQYRDLLSAAQAVTRLGERLRQAPQGIALRLALGSVSAVLRNEGIWIAPEQIALFRAFRLASGDSARDLARAVWAVRRLTDQTGAGNPQLGMHAFLGRQSRIDAVPDIIDERAVGMELDRLGAEWNTAQDRLGQTHPLTRAAQGFYLWRARGITPWDEVLEPTVAAMLVGAEGLAPFLPMAPGQRLDRHALRADGGAAQAQVSNFYSAARAGALAALMQLDRLQDWRRRARSATSDLTGRTPPLLIDYLTRLPVLSADLFAAEAALSGATARRNLGLFADRGLVREVTGQDRYRFWTAAV